MQNCVMADTGLVNSIYFTHVNKAERRKPRKRGRRIRQGKRAGLRRHRLKYTRVGLKNLRILYWNCASVYQRRAVFEYLVYKADIIAIQETRLGEGEEVRLSGYKCYYNGQHMGMALLAREDLAVSEVDVTKWNSDEIQLQAIRIPSEPPFVLVNVYACNGKVDCKKWESLSELVSMEKNLIFCGDFNAKGKSWGNSSSNNQGEELEAALESMDLICINSGCVTRIANRDGHEDSAIDLALVTPSLTKLCKWSVLGHYGSDHRPCSILVEKVKSRRQRPKTQSFAYDSSGQDIISKIRREKRRSCKGRKKRWEQPPWWNDEVEAAWTDKRRAVRAWQSAKQTRTVLAEHITVLKQNMDREVGKLKTLVKHVKCEKWAEVCERIGKDRSLKLFWRLHKSMNGVVRRNSVHDFQSLDQQWHRTDEDKGKALLSHFLEQSDQKDTQRRTAAREAIAQKCMNQAMETEDYITVDEVKSILRRAKNSAPGPDGIRYEDIGKLSERGLKELVAMYNDSIKKATVNEEWLHSYLVPLPKPDKDLTKIQGYRVITMQNTVGKLLEKFIARKLAYQLEQLNLLPSTLGGYRPGRETWTNAATFAYDVYEGFHAGVETCAVAIDLEDAYNRVPLDFLLVQLLELNISPFLLNWISAALFQRKVVFKCGTWASEPTTVHPALPQGSPLSPVLFNAYTVRITSEQINGPGRTLSYADDVLVYRQGRDRERIAADLQVELERIGKWCEEAEALVNPTKATVTWFSLNNRIVSDLTPNVRLCAKVMNRTHVMRYIGVWFDRSLAFTKHVDHVVTRARKGLSAMRVMAASNCEQRHLVLLYQGLVLSVIEYALAALTLSNTQIQRLERIQNEAMRIILGCTRDTACRAMRYLLDFPTMKDRMSLCKARAYLRISADTHHPLHSEVTSVKGARLKRGKSWMGQAIDVVQQVCSIKDIEPGEEWVRIPPNCCTTFRVCITLSRDCRQLNPIVVEAEVQALIVENSSESDVVIYTDGSVARHVRSSWAYTARVGGRTVKEESGGFAVTTSSMTMEIMAVTKAIAWLETQTFSSACVLSDSMSMLRKIETGWVRRQWLEAIGRTSLSTLCFIFVPGHAGVVGNERADRLAGSAEVQHGRAMDRADILNALIDAGRECDAANDFNSESMGRLRELKVKVGSAKQKRWAGPQRRIMNQHNTGVVSRYTLGDILREKSERVCTCPLCNEDDLTTELN